jgi:hypothetical protein
MADKKISQLTAVTTPLAVTEELPAVQSGATKKVTVQQMLTGFLTEPQLLIRALQFRLLHKLV